MANFKKKTLPAGTFSGGLPADTATVVQRLPADYLQCSHGGLPAGVFQEASGGCAERLNNHNGGAMLEAPSAIIHLQKHFSAYRRVFRRVTGWSSVFKLKTWSWGLTLKPSGEAYLSPAVPFKR